MVQAGQLSQPLDRPPGLKGVSNPTPATGGADPDTAADARASAPLHVQTLERVVSLEDYENFARAFAGVGKALATWTWFGHTRGVFVTVAGPGGAALDPLDSTIPNLIGAMRAAGNPYLPIRVLSYRPVRFRVAANVRVDTDNYDPDNVLAAVRNGLAAAFGFDARALGQGVAQSEIIAAIQNVPGVLAVLLTSFTREDPATRFRPRFVLAPAFVIAGAPAVPDFLIAGAPQAGARTGMVPAEMLLIDEKALDDVRAWQ